MKRLLLFLLTISSTTGQPYLVKCASGAPVQSGTWLLSQLQGMRASGGARRAP